MKTRLLVVLLVVAAGVAGFAPQAEACSCMPPDLVRGYRTSSDVVAATVLFGWEWGSSRYYLARVRHVFKGCYDKGRLLIARTPSSSAACGIELRRRTTYLLTGDVSRRGAGRRFLSINLCGFNVPWGSLTEGQKDFLFGRFFCCGDDCGCADGSRPVQCFVDPCEVSDCPEGACEANYCGGCFAEWYTEGDQMVCNACRSDDDCSWGQHCSDGECRTTCREDADCPEDEWCRPTESGPAACVPFVGEGEACGGYTPIRMARRCAPDLICTEFPPDVMDAPGVCRRPCETNRDCAADQYCALDGVCRDDGACWWDFDCELEGNRYLRPACEGFGLCEEGGCRWKCGNPSCADLAGVDLGDCEMILGWAVVDGRCRSLTGCGLPGFDFFATRLECLRACGRLEAVSVEAAAASLP